MLASTPAGRLSACSALKMRDLHENGVTPGGMQNYFLERIKVADNTLIIRASLEPCGLYWGPYKVYDLGQVIRTDRKIFLRLTIESSHSDQLFFAQQNPK